MLKVAKRKTPIFAWVSAVSLGGVLSFAMFLTGSDNFDSMMISLGLRSVVNTDVDEVVRIGNTYVGIAHYTVENLSASGVALNGFIKTHLNGETLIFNQSGAIKHPSGSTINVGSIQTAVVLPPSLASASTASFCNVTARYKFGIPVYHYNIGTSFRPPDERVLEAYLKYEPVYLLALEVAKAKGETLLQDIYISAQATTQYNDTGYTTNWNFCVDNWLDKSVNMSDIQVIDIL